MQSNKKTCGCYVIEKSGEFHKQRFFKIKCKKHRMLEKKKSREYRIKKKLNNKKLYKK